MPDDAKPAGLLRRIFAGGGGDRQPAPPLPPPVDPSAPAPAFTALFGQPVATRAARATSAETLIPGAASDAGSAAAPIARAGTARPGPVPIVPSGVARVGEAENVPVTPGQAVTPSAAPIDSQGEAPAPAPDPASPEARWARVAPPLDDQAIATWLVAIEQLAKEGDKAAARVGSEIICRLYPANVPLATSRARLAEACDDWAAALEIWTSTLARAPDNPVVAHGAASALARQDRLIEASRILDNYLANYGPEWDLNSPMGCRMAIEHAVLAQRQNSLVTAGQRWRRLIAEQPHNPVVRANYSHFQQRAQLAIADAEILAEMLKETSPEGALLMRFEALGGDCEFGFLQRHFGVEPLGLFRWSGLSVENVVAALNTGLAGVGDAEFTYLHIAHGKFDIMDRRYGLCAHTFQAAGDGDQATVLRRLMARTQLLRRKLLEDLALGEKTFLYRCREHMPVEKVLPLLDAVRRHNKANRLLIIDRLPPGMAATPVREIEPGFFHGAISGARDMGWTLDHAAWIAACEYVETKKNVLF